MAIRYYQIYRVAGLQQRRNHQRSKKNYKDSEGSYSSGGKTTTEKVAFLRQGKRKKEFLTIILLILSNSFLGICSSCSILAYLLNSCRQLTKPPRSWQSRMAITATTPKPHYSFRHFGSIVISIRTRHARMGHPNTRAQTYTSDRGTRKEGPEAIACGTCRT